MKNSDRLWHVVDHIVLDDPRLSAVREWLDGRRSRFPAPALSVRTMFRSGKSAGWTSTRSTAPVLLMGALCRLRARRPRRLRRVLTGARWIAEARRDQRERRFARQLARGLRDLLRRGSNRSTANAHSDASVTARARSASPSSLQGRLRRRRTDGPRRTETRPRRSSRQGRVHEARRRPRASPRSRRHSEFAA